MKLVVDVEAMQSTMSGGISGKIFFQIDGEFFPDKNWWDFPIVLLGWWCTAVASLCRSESDQATLYFMEGPFELELSHDGQGAVRCIGTGSGQTLEFESVLGLVREAVHSASMQVLEKCEREAWISSDIEALRSSFSSL